MGLWGSCARGALGVALLLGGASAAAADDRLVPSPPLELRVALVNLSGMNGASALWSLGQAGREFAPSGVAFSVSEAAAGRALPPGTLPVILVPGEVPGLERVKIVGATDSRQRTAIWIRPRGLASALGLRPGAQPAWPIADEVRFRRALCAVLVHELLHRFTGAAHASDGVMAPVLSRVELFRDHRVDPGLFGALRRGVAALGERDVAPASEAPQHAAGLAAASLHDR